MFDFDAFEDFEDDYDDAGTIEALHDAAGALADIEGMTDNEALALLDTLSERALSAFYVFSGG